MATLLSVNVGMPRDVPWQGAPCTPASGRARCGGAAWSAGSTSTATVRVTSPDMGLATGGARLPAGVLPVLAGVVLPRRPRVRRVRGELHRRRLADDEVCSAAHSVRRDPPPQPVSPDGCFLAMMEVSEPDDRTRVRQDDLGQRLRAPRGSHEPCCRCGRKRRYERYGTPPPPRSGPSPSRVHPDPRHSSGGERSDLATRLTREPHAAPVVEVPRRKAATRT